ncbi:MAG: DNA damage-inducible protein D [Spirochaetota bacterium]
MNSSRIEELFQKFESAKNDYQGIEFWSARDLQSVLGYSQWRNFYKSIERAIESAKIAGNEPENHFVGISKMVELGSKSSRAINDYYLTRYACYLIAQNGDTRKEEISFAQTYFAVQTRKQEIIQKGIDDRKRIEAREELTESEKILSHLSYTRGVDEKGFGIIRSEGDQALFGGNSTRKMKEKLGIPKNRPLADFLQRVVISAKNFATELTNYNTETKDLYGTKEIKQEHIGNNTTVRNVMLSQGIVPEQLPPAEDLKKVKRRLTKEEKKALESD